MQNIKHLPWKIAVLMCLFFGLLGYVVLACSCCSENTWASGNDLRGERVTRNADQSLTRTVNK